MLPEWAAAMMKATVEIHARMKGAVYGGSVPLRIRDSQSKRHGRQGSTTPPRRTLLAENPSNLAAIRR
jgi:hypothetical protein